MRAGAGGSERFLPTPASSPAHSSVGHGIRETRNLTFGVRDPRKHPDNRTRENIEGSSAQEEPMPSSISRITLVVGVLAVTTQLAAAQRPARVSVDTSGSQLPNGSRSSWQPVSGDGRFVAFESRTPHPQVPFVYVYDRETGVRTLASAYWPGGGPGIAFDAAVSEDGSTAAFISATALVSSDTNTSTDVYVRDLQAGVTEIVSISTRGTQADDNSNGPCLSIDGRIVAFDSGATTLVSGDTNREMDVFVHDRATGVTQRASVSSAGVQGNGASADIAISGDGRFVTFASYATNLVPGDGNGTCDIFLRDLQAGVTLLVSTTTSGTSADAASELSSISDDGRWVLFRSSATDLVPGVYGLQIYVRDMTNGATSLVSQSSGGAQANGGCSTCRLAGNGRFAVFSSVADNLVPNDVGGLEDLFLRDLRAGTTRLITLTAAGAQVPFHDLWMELGLSADGSHAVFYSARAGYIPGDTNSTDDVYVIDTHASADIAAYGTAKPNSQTCVPVVGCSGIPYASGFDSFFVIATQVLNRKPGLLFWGRAPANIPFGGGAMYVHSPQVRTPVQDSGGSASGDDCSGSYSFHFTQSYMTSRGLSAGDEIFCQYWSRDPGFAPPDDVGLTDALRFTIAP
jgi:Tol biopolymer transport system component